jgi:hypothetical protein
MRFLGRFNLATPAQRLLSRIYVEGNFKSGGEGGLQKARFKKPTKLRKSLFFLPLERRSLYYTLPHFRLQSHGSMPKTVTKR